MIKGGLVSVTFRKLSPQEIISLMKKTSLKAIEWGGDIHVPHGDTNKAKQVAALTEDAGLDCVAYGSYYRAGVSEEEGLSFNAVVDSALALKAPTVRIWIGKKGSADAEGLEKNLGKRLRAPGHRRRHPVVYGLRRQAILGP